MKRKLAVAVALASTSFLLEGCFMDQAQKTRTYYAADEALFGMKAKIDIGFNSDSIGSATITFYNKDGSTYTSFKANRRDDSDYYGDWGNLYNDEDTIWVRAAYHQRSNRGLDDTMIVTADFTGSGVKRIAVWTSNFYYDKEAVSALDPTSPIGDAYQEVFQNDNGDVLWIRTRHLNDNAEAYKTYDGPRPVKACTNSTTFVFKGWNDISEHVHQATYEELRLSDQIGFELDGVSAKVYAKSGFSATDIVLPALYNGAQVNTIKSKGFQACKSLATIDLKGVTTLEDRAFDQCENLESVKNLDKVNHLSDYAFSLCKNLKSAALSSILTSLPVGLFAEDTALASLDYNPVVITSGNSIGKECFHNCIYLQKARFSNQFNTIGDHAFDNCISLEYLRLKENVGIGTYLVANTAISVFVEGTTTLNEPFLGSFQNFSGLVFYRKDTEPTNKDVEFAKVFWHEVNGEPVAW